MLKGIITRTITSLYWQRGKVASKVLCINTITEKNSPFKCIFFSVFNVDYETKSKISLSLYFTFNSPNRSSSSSPRNRLWHFSGKSVWICFHRFKSTKVPFREFRLAQLDILIRQSGQRKFASCTFCLKHGPQSSCSHGITTGSIRICKQIGHVKSAGEIEFTFASLNFSVLSIVKLVTFFEVDVSSTSSAAILDLGVFAMECWENKFRAKNYSVGPIGCLFRTQPPTLRRGEIKWFV